MCNKGNFPYIEGVIRETLRMYPPATATAIRTLSEDTKLGNFLLPRGTNVMVNILALHHDDKLWPEPCEFRPERFIKVHNRQLAISQLHQLLRLVLLMHSI